MDLGLKEKVIIVTGGAKGIGKAISESLAKEGALVVIVGRNPQDNQKAVDEIREKGGAVNSITAELTRPEECKKVIDETLKEYDQIDGLVNNAGLNDGVGLEKGSPGAFIESLNKNVVHYYAMAHYALPSLIKSKGAIVNIGSKVAVTGQGGTSGYAASKGGVNALTREWALELLPYSIRVNTVLPAEVWTPQYEHWINNQPDPKEKLKNIVSKIPLEHRFTTAEEIADTVTFLLSGRSSHTTGEILIVDGGYIHLDRAINGTN